MIFLKAILLTALIAGPMIWAQWDDANDPWLNPVSYAENDQ